jgi:type IV pilus assembly protein PilV
LQTIRSKSVLGDKTLTHSKESKGFSLIEVLIALVILSISLLALAGLMVQTTQNNSFGNHMTEAATFGQDQLERLRARPFNSMIGGADVVTGSTGQVYNRSWVVTPNSTTAETTITINWNDPISHSISFTTTVNRN